MNLAVRKNVLIFSALIILLIAPLLVGWIVNDQSLSVVWVTRQLVVTVCLLLIPVAFFARKISNYFLLLTPLAVVAPAFICSIIFFRLYPGLEMIAVIMQTNLREAREALGTLSWIFIPVLIGYTTVYLVLVMNLRFTIPMLHAVIISISSFILAFGLIYFEKGLYYKSVWRLNRYDLLRTHHYPMSLLTAALDARSILKKNNLKNAQGFSFGAKNSAKHGTRQIVTLIIGEASRYDHWQLNGYKRETSPRLCRREGLISFDDVVSGAHYTWIAVPQLITRATPEDINRQFREKSIITAFHEAGFKTAWVSNQSDKEIFWTGSIVLHARTADYATFSPTYSPNFEFEDVYDERILPIVDSLVNSDSANLFLVVHLSGQHWDYSRRYPDRFDEFKPSGKTTSINPPVSDVKQPIINSYDNSIRYSDMIIDSVISIIDRPNVSSLLLFVSDHGEDLFDGSPAFLDFHFHPSPQTLRVPLFIWSSKTHHRFYPRKQIAANANKTMQVSARAVFYTLVDGGDITFPGFDSTESLLSTHFYPRRRTFFGDDKHAIVYDSLIADRNETRNN